MGGYLVIVTDTDTKDPVSNAIVTLHADDTLSIRLPNSRQLDYADQTTVTVLLTKDKSAVEGMFVTMTDKHDNYCAGNTDSNGQVTVPGTSGKTNEDGNTTVGWEDEDGDRWTLTVTVEDYETGRPSRTRKYPSARAAILPSPCRTEPIWMRITVSPSR